MTDSYQQYPPIEMEVRNKIHEKLILTNLVCTILTTFRGRLGYDWVTPILSCNYSLHAIKTTTGITYHVMMGGIIICQHSLRWE